MRRLQAVGRLLPYTTLFRSVHMSADGELVIMHDTTVDRTTDARKLYPNRTDRSIAGMNAAQIATLDAGGWKGEEFAAIRSEEHTSELQSRGHLVCRLLLEKE